MSTPEEREEKKWEQLLAKLLKHQQSETAILLMPNEVALLTKKLYQLTKQLLDVMQWHDKYAPLVKSIVEIQNGIDSAGAGDSAVPDGTTAGVDEATDPAGLRSVAGSPDA